MCQNEVGLRFFECIIESLSLQTQQQYRYQQQQQWQKQYARISTDGYTEHYKKATPTASPYVAYVVMNCHYEEQQQRCHPCPVPPPFLRTSTEMINMTQEHTRFMYELKWYDTRNSTRNSTGGCKKIVIRYIFKTTRSVSLACTISARQLRLARGPHSSVSSTTWGKNLEGSARPNAQAAAGRRVPIQGQELPAVCRQQQCWRWIWSKNLQFFSRRGKRNAKARISRRLRPRPRPHRAALAVSALTSPNAMRDAPPLSFLLSLQQRIPT